MMKAAAVLLAAGLALPGFAAQGDAAAGQRKAQEVCANCHGADGNSSSPDFPRLAGQSADYIATALAHYKNGKRNNPIMRGFVSGLSEHEMLDIGAWYASQKGLEMKY